MNFEHLYRPSNPALMGLNIGGGAEVKLRLRRPNSEWDFFPYEQILDTMLHELCHNEYGPHNSDFYRLLDEIRKVAAHAYNKDFTAAVLCLLPFWILTHSHVSEILVALLFPTFSAFLFLFCLIIQ